MGTLKRKSHGPLYSNIVIGTLAVDGWAVTFGTVEGAWAGCSPTQSPPLFYGLKHWLDACVNCQIKESHITAPWMASRCNKHIWISNNGYQNRNASYPLAMRWSDNMNVYERDAMRSVETRTLHHLTQCCVSRLRTMLLLLHLPTCLRFSLLLILQCCLWRFFCKYIITTVILITAFNGQTAANLPRHCGM